LVVVEDDDGDDDDDDDDDDDVSPLSSPYSLSQQTGKPG
jgi:hypothetical protein